MTVDKGRERKGVTPEDEDRTLSSVTRGLLHDLANLATALDGITAALKHDGPQAIARAEEDLRRTTVRVFALHAQLRSLMSDHGGAEAIDPRAVASEVAALLRWHATRSCALLLDPGPAAPILGESWRVRRQFLAACDSAAGESGDLRFGFRVEGTTVSSVRDDGFVFWSSPTLTATRALERAGG